jgi:CRP-like cAMP-binding protein
LEKLFTYLETIAPLSDELKERLADTLRFQKVAKKLYFLRAGQVSDRIAFIHSGLFRSFYRIHGIETCAWFMKENDIIMEDAELYYLTYKELLSIYADFPSFLYIGKTLTEHYYVLSEERSYAMRNQRSHERYRYLSQYDPELIRRVPSKYLASYLGITEVTLSNIKRRGLPY